MKLTNNKYYELTSIELQTIDKDTYIKELKKMIDGLEEQIKLKFKKTTTQNEYLKLLEDIKKRINHLENIEYFELTQDKVNFLNSVIELRKKLHKISLTEKVEIFMRYISTNDIPKQQENIKFSDIDQNITDDTLIGKWYVRQLYDNLENFKLEIEKHKNIYPKSYEIIVKRIEILPKTKQLTQAFRKKTEIFMKLIEEEKLSLPIKNYKKTFNQMVPGCGINSRIKDWLHNTITKERDYFLSICLENKEKYPNAYKTIINYLDKETKENRLDHENRIKLWLKYTEQNNIPNSKDKITFVDLEPTCKDYTNIADWFSRQISTNLNGLKTYLEKYKDTFPIGYIQSQKRIEEFLKSHKTNDLTTLEKIEIFMKYINTNEIPTSQNKIRFKDIYPTSTCEAVVYNWMMKNIFKDKKTILEIIDNYKNKYSNACIKLQKNIEKLIEKRSSSSLKAPFEVKARLFIKYVEKNKIPSDWCYKRFCDIDPDIKDTTKIGNWFRDQLSKNLNRLYTEVNKYKDIYPQAYLKIINRINNSEAMIKKQRKLLIVALTQIKQELNNNEKVKKYSK